MIAMINGIYGTQIRTDVNKVMHKVSRNLYLIKTPHVGTQKQTCIEDMLPNTVKSVKLSNKTFSSRPKFDVTKHFGKVALASFVQQNASTISFVGFEPLITAINEAIGDASS